MRYTLFFLLCLWTTTAWGFAPGFLSTATHIAPATAGGYATPSRVQRNYSYSNSAAYSGAVTSGNILIAIVRGSGHSGSVSVSDSVNGAWSQAGLTLGSSDQSAESFVGIYYKANTASGTPTVTATITTLTDPNIEIMEFSGIVATSPLDGYQGQNSQTAGGASTSFDSGTGVAASQTHVLIVGGYENYSAINTSTYPNYTQVHNDVSNSGGATYQRILTDASGSYDFSGTMGSSNNAWAAANAIFKAASL